MSAYWQQHWYGAGGFLFVLLILTFATVGSEGKLPPSFAGVKGGTNGVVEEKTWAERKSDELQSPTDHFVDQDHSAYLGYTVERRQRRVFLEGDDQSLGIWIDVAFVSLKNGKRLVKTFDADIYSGFGNSANFGFFPFLADGNKQLFVSQDAFRGGSQWVVRLTPNLKVLFDGEKLNVGREGYDLSVVDLDDDGTFEIMVPITDTYEFQDKMSPSQVPHPTIIFKYDSASETYLPANSLFKNYVYEDVQPVSMLDSTLQSQAEHRSTLLNNLLTYIYAGEEQRAWKFFEQNYQLHDKEEIRTRVKEMLRTQPVYHLIYRRG